MYEIIEMKNDEFQKIDGILSNVKPVSKKTIRHSTSDLPIKDKPFLTLTEASKYFGIGVNKLRSLIDGDGGKYAIWVGNKRLIKRTMLEHYLETAYSI